MFMYSVCAVAMALKLIFAIICYFQLHLFAASTLTLPTCQWSRTSDTVLENGMLPHKHNCGFLGVGDTCENILEAEIFE